MENPQQHINTLISMVSAVIAIVLSDVQTFISITAGCVAIVAGVMSIRNSHYHTLKNKKGIKDE